MLQTIALSVCMLFSPYACKDIELYVSSEYGESLQLPFHCYRQAQIEGAKWINEHPDWRIESWRCPAPRNGQKA